MGTLRCVQAIVKMQALVRARRARLEEEVNGKVGKDTHNSIISVMQLESNKYTQIN